MAVVKKQDTVPAYEYTDEKFEDICERIGKGEMLREICREKGMGFHTVYRWMDRDDKLPEEERKNLRSRFMRARDEGFDSIAEETLRIADDGTNDWMEKHNDRGDMTGWRVNGECVQRSRLRVETRLRLLAKWSPNKYGDSVNLNHGGQKDNPLLALLNHVSGTGLTPIEKTVEDVDDDSDV